MNCKNAFVPKTRFLVVSDIHYKDEPSVERERMALALKKAYIYSENDKDYKFLDAVFVVGDFANSGSETQMQAFKTTLKEGVKDATEVTVSLASHEFNSGNGGEPAALEKLGRIFGMEPDVHKIINGFHFISVSCTNGCRFDDPKQKWVADELKKAAADDPKKPIFFFQHPHISGTVYGSINWGEDELTAILMNYPQIIDFSGHSHAPINDPRSIHQKYFTALGTGTLSYFELDEFDKIYGTVPPNSKEAAQMLIVEADENNRVRVYPYDLISENFFPFVWEIDTPGDPTTFTYTDDRYKTSVAPHFEDDAKISVSEITGESCVITFDQALIEKEYIDDYYIVIKRTKDKTIAKQLSVWSQYYLYNMPSTISQKIADLDANEEYSVEIYANSFWKIRSQNSLTGSFKTEK